jgi:hypothetical protein
MFFEKVSSQFMERRDQMSNFRVGQVFNTREVVCRKLVVAIIGDDSRVDENIVIGFRHNIAPSLPYIKYYHSRKSTVQAPTRWAPESLAIDVLVSPLARGYP